ncbi:MAG: mechanosensitive ion channel family protein [Firmicutes bacterium]|nr:mechanosensitive ion channel family protein [Bacillota bacterium]
MSNTPLASFVGEVFAGRIPPETLINLLLRFGSSALNVIIILVLVTIALKVSGRVVDQIFKTRETEQLRLFHDTRRLETLRTLTKSIARYVIYFVGAIMILGEFGVNTSGVLAGAGIAGLALGFGAQNLVRDVISGFFILFEDQYAVGDYVELADISGTVEEMGLRVTRVRDFAGQLHIIPNGSVGRVTNYRGRGMRVMFDVQVSYSTDVDRAIGVLQKLFDEQKEQIGGVVDGPRVLGVQSLGESGVSLRVWALAQPMEQWRIARELNRLIKKTFDENGIEIPFPHRKIIIDQRGDLPGGITS